MAIAVRAAEGTEHRIIGALLDSVVARESPARLVERMADPAIRIVSLTVTEKGYCHTPQTGDLDERHPDVVHDLNNFDAPRSAPGFIVAALARRRAQGVPPFTVLCCDNLAANGHTVQRIVTQFAALRSKDLGKWIADTAAFPSTMVDRIVPETTDADRDAVSISARYARRLARDDRAVHAMGGRGPLSRRAGPILPPPASSSSPTSSRSS